MAAVVCVASIGLVACGGKGGNDYLSIYNGDLTVQINSNGDNIRGKVVETVTGQELVNNGARKTNVNFDLAQAVADYQGFFETVQPNTNNMEPREGSSIVPFAYEQGWELEIRVIVEIRDSEGTLVPRNALAPDVRVLWEHYNGTFWDANIIHNRGLGTDTTGGTLRAFNTTNPNTGLPVSGIDTAYRLNAGTLPAFNNMTFYIAGFTAGEYEITFRVAVATACMDAGHTHYQTYIFNDLAAVTQTFTVKA